MSSQNRNQGSAANIEFYPTESMDWNCATWSILALLLIILVAADPSPGGIFQEVPASNSGISWVHNNGRSPQRYLPETVGAGIAIFDYDNDGWMDILFVNSGASNFYAPHAPVHPMLYHNNGDGTFTDVSERAGITADLFGMGVAVGDYDGDGYPDVFITGLNRCVLYHNNRNGTFTDVTSISGITASQWGTSALWFDYDNDGKLDLFVGEFAEYRNQICGASDSYGGEGKKEEGREQTYYCTPLILKPRPSHLYRNLGNGKFRNVSEKTGIASRSGRTWGAVAADINGDGYLDVFASNDLMPNFLWVNRHGERFEEIGAIAGVGYSDEGVARSGMGVDAGDFDCDGRVDLFVANIDLEKASLYHNAGHELFEDVSLRTEVGPATRGLSGWGSSFLDYDNDGWIDLVLANGHPNDLVEEHGSGITYRQPLLLFHNENGKNMQNVSSDAGNAFRKSYSARGLAIGDLNNDGFPDIVFMENGGPVHVLMNTAAARNHWLGLKLEGKTSNHDAIGAVIRWSVGGKVITRQKIAGGSFLSSRDPREILGAGQGPIDWLEIHWPKPSEQIDRILHPAMDRYMVVTEKQGVSK